MFLGKGVLKINSKSTGEHPCQSAISIKLQSNSIEITLRHGCSPVNLLHVFRTPFYRNTSGWRLLNKLVNPFHATEPFWYTLKRSKNQRFSDVFKGYQKRSVARNGLKCFLKDLRKLSQKSVDNSMQKSIFPHIGKGTSINRRWIGGVEITPS